jgi:hypothetical protein
MKSTNSIERSWWRRLARRKRAEAPRTNRLSHFEPLEQRTVLSASVLLPGGGDFFQPPHDAYRYDSSGPGSGYFYDVAPQRDVFGGEHIGPALNEEYASHEELFAPHPYNLLLPLVGVAHDLPVEGRLTSPVDYSGGEGESTTATSTLASSASAPVSLVETSYHVEIVIVHDDAPPRVTMLTPIYASAADNGIFASLMAAMQRRVEPPPPTSGYPDPSRGNLSTLTDEAGPAVGKTLESTLQSSPASLLAALGNRNGVASDSSAHISMVVDDGGSSEHPLSQNAVSRRSGEDADGASELDAADLAIQKRKLAVSSEARTAVNTRLDDLTDIPVIRITESLFRELLVLYADSSPASAQSAQAPHDADDGMIELLAADVGSLASRNVAASATDHPRPVTAESGIALYQSLEVAGLDDIGEVAAEIQAVPVAPPELVAKAE